MTPDTIISETNQRFKIVRDPEGNPVKLGYGLTSTVYKARLEDVSEDIFFAAKVMHANLLASTMEDFRNEIVIIQAVYNECRGKKFVPAAYLGHDPAQPGLPIILMEYVSPDWRLSKLLTGSDQRLSEDIGLKTGLQYVQMLQVLHEKAGYFTHGDRKAGDLHWDKANNRLIVLDWNRARKFPQEPELQKECKRQDIRIFAQLWAELLLGRRVHSLPDPDDLADPVWAGLMLGTRTILEKAYSNRSDHWYENTEDIEHDLQEHIDRSVLARSKPAVLLGQAEDLYGEAAREKGTFQRSDLARRVLVAVDLITRHSKITSGMDRQRTEKLAHSARELIEATRIAFDQKIKETKNLIDNGQYPRARDTLGRELAAIENGRSFEETQARIQFRRWIALCKVAILAADARIPKARERVRDVLDALADLHVAIQGFSGRNPVLLDQHLHKISDRIDHASSDFGDGVNAETIRKFRAGFTLIQREIEVRRNCLTALANADKPDLENQSLETAVAAWNELHSEDSGQSEDLIETLRNLEEHIESKTFQRIEERRLENAHNEFRLQVTQILQVLQNFSVPLVSSPGFVRQLDYAIELYRRDLVEDDWAKQVALTEDYDLLCTIRSVCNDIQQNVAQALQSAGQLIVRAERTEARSSLIRLCAQAVIDRLKQITYKKPCWPHELLEGERLVMCLEEAQPVISAEPWWNDWLNNHASVFATRLNEMDNWHKLATEILSREDRRIDDALDRANEHGIEFAEGNELVPGEKEVSSVLTMTLARRGFRMSRQVKKITDELSRLIQLMDSNLEVLKRQKQDGDSQLEKVREVSENFDKVSLPSVIDKIDRAQSQLGALAESSKSLEEASLTLETSRSKAERTLADAQSALGSMGTMMQSLNVALAISAVMDLNTEEAKRYCELAYDYSAAEPNSELKQLQELTQWLEETAKDPKIFSELTAWKDALRSIDKPGAEKHYSMLVNQHPREVSFWRTPVVAKLFMEYQVLIGTGWPEMFAVARQGVSQNESQKQFQGFESRARQLLSKPVDTAALDELEQEIKNQTKCVQTRYEAEILDGWERRLEQARNMQKGLERFDNISESGNVSLLQENLTKILNETSADVFSSQFSEWNDRLMNLIRTYSFAGATLLDRGKRTAELGKKILAESAQ